MIRRLPRDVVDRIAAGEVVERPASVVKELVENALDAGARQVEVALEGGGLGLIRVADDGCGLSRDELALAVAPHATSKLVDVDDLFHIASFGFRGEALASIAAVSRLRLVSMAAGAEAGWSLEVQAGEAGALRPAAARPGTVVEVRDLFFNTPARRRFLGATSTEAARAREIVTCLALVHPEIHWRVVVDGQPRFAAASGGALRERVALVYGEEFAGSLLPVAAQGPIGSLEGLVSLPAAARPRPRAQLLFVNGRLVRDRGIAAAVRAGFKDFLPGSLQPSWVLRLTVDPLRLDVNVHPTKAEVRFRDRDELFRLVRRACREALLAADLAPRVRAEHLSGLEGASPGRTWGPPGAGVAPGPSARRADGPPPALPEPRLQPPAGAGAAPPGAVVPGASPTGDGPAAGGAVAEGQLALGPLRAASRFLQVLRTYIAHDSPEGLVLVDQHALHERILYARLQADLAAGRLERQRLLVQQPVRLSPSEHERALHLRDELHRMGLEIDDFGPDTVVVRAVPAVLRNEDVADLVRALVDPPDLHGGLAHGLDRRLFTMACHAAVKAGDPLDEREIAALLEQGAALEHDATCPHGRPTRLLIGRAELERLFKRSGF